MIAPIWLADSLDDAIYLKLNRKDSVVGYKVRSVLKFEMF